MNTSISLQEDCVYFKGRNVGKWWWVCYGLHIWWHVLDAMKMKCFFQLNREKLQNLWDEAGLSSLYYILTVLVLYLIFLGLTILMETYKVDNKLINDQLLIRQLIV